MVPYSGVHVRAPPSGDRWVPVTSTQGHPHEVRRDERLDAKLGRGAQKGSPLCVEHLWQEERS